MGFPAKTVHLIGIGGVGMSGVARMLLCEGVAVSGSDITDGETLAGLRESGAVVAVGHSVSNVPPDTQMVVVSAAIKDDNPEVVEARRRNVEVIKYARALGLLMAEKQGVAVSGTHGKTTTTAMIATILDTAGLDPSFVVGGYVPGLKTSSREGSGEVFVAEACEYDRSFLNLAPRIAVVTNIEEDHLDYYRDLAEIKSAFRDFVRLIDREGLLLVNAHDKSALAVAEAAAAPVETFGARIEADWQASELAAESGKYSFEVAYRGEALGTVSLAIPGVHNALNALAAAAVSRTLGVEFAVIAEALSSFGGAARRFQTVGKAGGVTVIDDYAHHPTEIQVTLKAAREFFRDGRLWVVFQPHQHSRTRFFLKDFARSFSNADKVIIPDIYFVRDSEADRACVNAADLVRELINRDCDAEYINGWDAIVERISSSVEPGDVVMTMGAGNVYEVAYALLEKLR